MASDSVAFYESFQSGLAEKKIKMVIEQQVERRGASTSKAEMLAIKRCIRMTYETSKMKAARHAAELKESMKVEDVESDYVTDISVIFPKLNVSHAVDEVVPDGVTEAKVDNVESEYATDISAVFPPRFNVSHDNVEVVTDGVTEAKVVDDSQESEANRRT